LRIVDRHFDRMRLFAAVVEEPAAVLYLVIPTGA
jgi:hypothetical protein